MAVCRRRPRPWSRAREAAAGLYGGAGLDQGDTAAVFGEAAAPRRRARYRRQVEHGTTWQTSERAPAADHALGARVFHQKFGYGAVVARDGDKLEIAFEKAGNKKVLASFVEAT